MNNSKSNLEIYMHLFRSAPADQSVAHFLGEPTDEATQTKRLHQLMEVMAAMVAINPEVLDVLTKYIASSMKTYTSVVMPIPPAQPNERSH